MALANAFSPADGSRLAFAPTEQQCKLVEWLASVSI